jgi:trk system potassium uptake protein TrkH
VRVNAIIASLIVAGGLGFGVLREVAASALCRACRRRAPRLSLQARIALSASVALLLGGTIGIALLEWSRSLAGLGGGTRVLAAAFHSVSARTAGFNSVDLGRMGPAALLLVMALMFVGGSPGGTAGGIKTTTAAACFFTLRGMLRGRDRVEVARRTLPADLLGKALALTGIAGLTLLVGTLALLATQPFDPLALAFEATSAFATTGLSTGITAKLGPFGKLVLMALMFAGRTGPLTLVFALAAARRPPPPVTFPEERIMIG